MTDRFAALRPALRPLAALCALSLAAPLAAQSVATPANTMTPAAPPTSAAPTASPTTTAPASATPSPASTTPATPPAQHFTTVHVTLTTSEGPIGIDLETQRAPVTAGNFLRYVDQKRLDGINIYRVVKVEKGYGLVQGGVRNDPKRVLKAIAHEPTSQTGLSHTDGAISMARSAPGTASGDFFFVVGGFPTMDADPKQTGDNQGFAVFGHVTSGMDIVRHILEEPTSPTAGEGAMKGQMLDPPVKIISAKRG
jgi:peptidyl-prolyl cis-trans isomerase A (cyclophilin A)